MMDRDFEDPFLRAAISSGGDMARVAARIAYRQMIAVERLIPVLADIRDSSQIIAVHLARLEQMFRPPVLKAQNIGADLKGFVKPGGFYVEGEAPQSSQEPT